MIWHGISDDLWGYVGAETLAEDMRAPNITESSIQKKRWLSSLEFNNVEGGQKHYKWLDVVLEVKNYTLQPISNMKMVL